MLSIFSYCTSLLLSLKQVRADKESRWQRENKKFFYFSYSQVWEYIIFIQTPSPLMGLKYKRAKQIQTSGSQTGPKSRVVDDSYSHSFLAIDKSLFTFLIILFSSICITLHFLFHWLSASTKKHPSFSWTVQKLNQLCSSASPN